MKKKFYLLKAGALLLLLLIPALLPAQFNPLAATNAQLRQIFAGLTRPPMPRDFLYEMCGHVTPDSLWTRQSADTLTSDTWYRMWDEHFDMAYDTMPLPRAQSIFDSIAEMNGDTIPVGILDVDFYRLKPNALTTNQYFFFDIVNDLLTDIPGRPDEPYTVHNVFAAAPLFGLTKGSDVTFVIAPQYIFFDSYNASYYNNVYDLEIDFGDGAGPQRFDPTVTTYYTANYSTSMPYANLTTTISYDHQLYKRSKSLLTLGTASSAMGPPPDYTYDTDDLHVGVYDPCSNPGDRKIVIYLPGFNPLDFIPRLRRNERDIYGDMLSNPKIAMLRNFGYEFHIVSYNSSSTDIRTNGYAVVQLIDNLKLIYGTDQQFIVIGESMGGLVGRWALSFMESAAYQDPLAWPTGYARSFMHNTREFIMLDVPNQGANVPLAYQTLYDEAIKDFGWLFPMSNGYMSKKMLQFLTCDAARQMLVYHIDTKSGTNYTADPMQTQFFSDLYSLNNSGYPQFCKLVALSNGALDGTAQMRFYNHTPRVPNDHFMDFTGKVYARVLWFTVPIIDAQLELQSAVNGTGRVYHHVLAGWHCHIKFYWFGVNLQIGYFPYSTRDEYADVLPLDVSPGGFVGPGIVVGSSSAAPPHDFIDAPLNFFVSYRTSSDGNGCWAGAGHIGIDGFSSVNLQLSVCSDGTHFCLIPIQSALDYGTLGISPTLFYDITSDSYVTKMASTPMDIISGIAPGDYWLNIQPNKHHLYIKYANNEGLHMSTYFNYNYTGCNLYRHWLAAEIGDEIIYLNNLQPQWNSTYESYDYLLVGAFNSTYGVLPGLYQRNDPFAPAPGVVSTFKCNISAGPPPHYTIGLPLSSYMLVQTNGINCCNSYRLAPPHPAPATTSGSSFDIYPNPADGRQTLMIALTLGSESPVACTVYDLYGRALQEKTLAEHAAEGAQTFELPLDPLQLPPGVYLVSVRAEGQQLTRRLIVE